MAFGFFLLTELVKGVKAAAKSIAVALCAVVLYYLGHTITMVTLPSISNQVPEGQEGFAATALKTAHTCVDWPLIKPLIVKYQIADVVPFETGELRAELAVYSVYRLRITTFIVFGRVGRGPYRCAHIDIVE